MSRKQPKECARTGAPLGMAMFFLKPSISRPAQVHRTHQLCGKLITYGPPRSPHQKMQVRQCSFRPWPCSLHWPGSRVCSLHGSSWRLLAYRLDSNHQHRCTVPIRITRYSLLQRTNTAEFVGLSAHLQILTRRRHSLNLEISHKVLLSLAELYKGSVETQS